MKQIIILIFLTFSLPCFSQSQMEMNIGAYGKSKESDVELNEIYKKYFKVHRTCSTQTN